MPYQKRKIPNHTRIYFEAFGYDLEDPNQFVPSEINGKKAVDIHHIIGRGKGGEDRIENLMALTRLQHLDWGDKKNLIWNLLSMHRQHMKEHGVQFDNDWIEEKMGQYAYETEQ